MKEAFIAVSGMILQVAVGLSTIFLFKLAIVSRSALGRLAGKLDASTRGITNSAKEFGENRNFYQRRQQARDQRKGEQRRENVSNYAEAITADSWRGRQLRRRSTGGLGAQVVGTLTGGRRELNAAGQQRALQSAQDIQRKQHHEEADRATKRMNSLGIEGDDDLMNIARGGGYFNARDEFVATPGQFQQQRRDANGVYQNTGIAMPVGEAERQAAINELVSQGRISPLRQLENSTPNLPRGAGGTPNPDNALHTMLDDAYNSIPNKLGDKSPDIAPNRRASGGAAAFTDLQPKDVSAWHHSTVAAAERYYDNTGDNVSRDQALRAFSEAAGTPATLASLSPEQVQNFRNMMERYAATGATIDTHVRDAINDAFTRKGFSLSDPVPAAPPPPPTPR